MSSLDSDVRAASYKIRTWLASIIGRAEILLEAPAVPLTTDMVHDVESILATARQLLEQWTEVVETASEGLAETEDLTSALRSVRRLFLLPLRTIIAHCEWLLERVEESGFERLALDVGSIHKATQSLLAFIDEWVGRSSGGGAVAEPTPEQALPASEVRADRILVVDDSRTNRLILSTHLKSQGFEVVAVGTGQAALDAALEGNLDLVLLDIVMEGMSGLEVLRLLRMRHSVADLPIIMVTGMQGTKETVEALDLGANDYVTKPIDFRALLARMRTHLSLKRATAEVRSLAAALKERSDFIRATMDRYLSTQVVESLLETPDGLRLGGELRTCTILMSDLRGFTTMTQSIQPEQVVRILNRYLGAMSDIIRDHGGTVDEFIGDAILALFGAPVQGGDDAERAVACAVKMQRAMDAINRSNRQEGLPEIQMGIAVNTGEVIVGNIGSTTRAKYGAVGNPVNTTARIESLTVGGQVLISAATLDAAGSIVEVDVPQVIQAQGLREALTVYNVRGVGGSHGVALLSFESQMQALVAPIEVGCARMRAKRQHGEEFVMRVVSLSLEEAELRGAETVEPLDVLRLRVTTPEQGLLAGDAYAKVIRVDEQGDLIQVRFTALSPPIEDYFQRALRG